MPTLPPQATSRLIWLPELALIALTVPEGLFILGVGLLGEVRPGYLYGGLAIPVACSALVAMGLGAVKSSRSRFAVGLAVATGFPVCVGMLAIAGIPEQAAGGGSVWENVRYAVVALTVSCVPMAFALAARAVRRLVNEP